MKLTDEQMDKLNGCYDTAALHFGGDAVLKVEEKYFKEDKLGYLNWLERAAKKINKSNYTQKIVGKRVVDAI
jgi:hypothetical protein